jgi:hypothetical protein
MVMAFAACSAAAFPRTATGPTLSVMFEQTRGQITWPDELVSREEERVERVLTDDGVEFSFVQRGGGNERLDFLTVSTQQAAKARSLIVREIRSVKTATLLYPKGEERPGRMTARAKAICRMLETVPVYPFEGPWHHAYHGEVPAMEIARKVLIVCRNNYSDVRAAGLAYLWRCKSNEDGENRREILSLVAQMFFDLPRTSGSFKFPFDIEENTVALSVQMPLWQIFLPVDPFSQFFDNLVISQPIRDLSHFRVVTCSRSSGDNPPRYK